MGISLRGIWGSIQVWITVGMQWKVRKRPRRKEGLRALLESYAADLATENIDDDILRKLDDSIRAYRIGPRKEEE